MQSVTVAERREKLATSHRQAQSGAEGNQPMDQALPELSFVHPIPGFTDLRRFVLVRLDPPTPVPAKSTAETDASAESAAGAGLDATPAEAGVSPLYELRSLERPQVRFMMAVPGAYFSDYEIELDDQECGDLGLVDSEDALVLVMLTVGSDAASTTANLLAPVVINARTRVAAQVILTGSDWPVRAPIG
ncbi:MAG TPA: flagellar assembly protein FliW [Kineosporiaceae bacterium]|nr:flagellar assembly protein FliW [Kineosporiaceae bacterium]